MVINDFYSSQKWRELRNVLIHERGFHCDACGLVLNPSQLIAHHITPLTEENVNNVNISLNPDNIRLICQRCHNEEHFRFGTKKEVFFVWGSPLSGKSTYVKENIKYGDIVLDIDLLWRAITLQPLYIKPEPCNAVIFLLRDKLLEIIRERSGSWYRAFVISSGFFPEVKKLSDLLGAKFVPIITEKEVCLARASSDFRPLEYQKYIEKFFSENKNFLKNFSALPPGDFL